MLALVMCPVWCGILAQIHIWVLNGLSFSSSQGALTPALLVPLLGFAFILTMFKTCNLFKIVPKIKREARHRAVLPTLQQQTRDPIVPIVLSQPLLEPPHVTAHCMALQERLLFESGSLNNFFCLFSGAWRKKILQKLSKEWQHADQCGSRCFQRSCL